MLITKLALILISVILVGSFTFNTYFLAKIYSSNMSNSLVQRQIDDLRNQILGLQGEKASLQDQLQRQQSEANPPELVTRLGAKDIRASPYANHPWSGEIRFFVSGEVWNAGQISAYNCTLHIVLYQGTTVANDTHVMLGTIEPGSFVDVSTNVYYAGEVLTTWNIDPEIGR